LPIIRGKAILRADDETVLRLCFHAISPKIRRRTASFLTLLSAAGRRMIMSDQAQGLRALADQTRRDHIGPSLSTHRVPEDASVGTLDPERSTPLVERGVVVADARLHSVAPPPSSATAVVAPVPRTRARVIAVTSGKGGVGKTNFSSNLSLVMARSGLRVIAVDADLGLANLHVILGVTPRYHLEHVIRGERTLQEALHSAADGLQIIAGGSGITELANLDGPRREAFIAGLSELDALADVILLDTGAGLSHNVLSFLCAVEEVVVVTTPEPTAITDAYATIKVVTQENPSARLMLVVNMAQSETEAEAVANRLSMIASQFLHIQLEFLGYIPTDPAVSRAVRIQKPFTLSQPDSAAAHSVIRIAAQLGYQPPRDAAPSGVRGFLSRMQRFFASSSKS
jgi:flagellar biosynthesis protein FlhG